MKMKSACKFLLTLFVIFIINVNLSARINVTITAPQTGNATADAELQSLADGIASNLESNEPIIASNKDKMMEGFANSNVYATHSSSLIGFQGYDFLSISVGSIVGFQVPDLTDLNVITDLKEEGDVELGISSGATINVGINAGFLVEGLYLNGKFGTYSFSNSTFGDVEYKSITYGVGAQYRVIDGVGLGFGLARWRGVFLGTGIYFHKNELDLEVELDEVSDSASITGYGTVNMTVDPTLNLGLDMDTYTIPLEVSTSFQALWIVNLGLGAGIDFSKGSSELTADAIGSVRVDDSSVPQNGHISVSENTGDGKPSFVNLRFTVSPGLNLGPVKVEAPFTWYASNGYAVGVTMAAQF